MSSDTRFAYEELAALCADLLAARDRAARRQLVHALAHHLQIRCRRCGALLLATARRGPPSASDRPRHTETHQAAIDELRGLCEQCLAEYIPPPPPGYRERADDGDVPF